MSNTHAVYAVLDTIHGPHKVRVSDHLPGNEPWDVFEALEADPRPAQARRDVFGRYLPRKRRIVNPGFAIYGRPVRFFAVRSTDDPQWPANAPVLRLTDLLGR